MDVHSRSPLRGEHHPPSLPPPFFLLLHLSVVPPSALLPPPLSPFSCLSRFLHSPSLFISPCRLSFKDSGGDEFLSSSEQQHSRHKSVARQTVPSHFEMSVALKRLNIQTQFRIHPLESIAFSFVDKYGHHYDHYVRHRAGSSHTRRQRSPFHGMSRPR